MSMIKLDLTNEKEVRRYIRLVLAVIIVLLISLVWMWDSAKSVQFYMDCKDLAYKKGITRVTEKSPYWDRLPARSDGDGDGIKCE